MKTNLVKLMLILLGTALLSSLWSPRPLDWAQQPTASINTGASAGEADPEASPSRPLAFEPNQGQMDKAVKFLVHGRGQQVYLTSEQVVLQLTPAAGSAQTTVLRLRFVNANPEPALFGQDRLPGVVNYYIGQDPAGWHTGIPTFGRVKYAGLYPGIDAVFYGTQEKDALSQIEHDFLVAPGADPQAIAMEVEGARGLRLDEQGNLLIETAGKPVLLRKPVLYQMNGRRRTFVEGAYQPRGRGQFGYRVGAYNHLLPLIIDPVIDFSTYFGGSSDDYGYAITTDAAGNVYLTGATNSHDFPAAAGFAGAGSQCPSDLPTRECYDAFVTKINPAGTAILYSTYIGNPGEDEGRAIVVDNSGNAYITGLVSLAGAPPLEDLFIYKYALVAKLGPTGAMAYGFAFGNGPGLIGYGIDIDSQGQAYVVGEVSGSIPTTGSAIQPQKGEMTDGFLAIFNAAGNGVLYSTYLGGNNTYCGVCASKVTGVAVDGAGKAYVTGQAAPSFPTTPNAYRSTFGGLWEGFVAKIDPTLSGMAGLLYSSYIGGEDTDLGSAITLDATGKVYLTGSTQSDDFPTTAGALDRACGSDGVCNPTTVCNSGTPPVCYTDPKTDVFVVKMDLTQSGAASFLYGTYVGGGGQEVGNGIVVDNAGGIQVAGKTWSPDFPTKYAYQAAIGGKDDIFLFELNPAGSQLNYATFIGGGSNDEATGIARDANGNTYLTGSTGSGAYPVVNPLRARSGGWEAFILRLKVPVIRSVYLPFIKK